MRMMNGTPSIPAYYAALAGLDIINQVGVERDSREVQADDGTAARRWSTSTASRRRPHAIPSDWLARSRSMCPTRALVSKTLKAREFIVDYRPPVGIRVSPHFYNTLDEIERTIAEIVSIVNTRDYTDTGHRSLVT